MLPGRMKPADADEEKNEEPPPADRGAEAS